MAAVANSYIMLLSTRSIKHIYSAAVTKFHATALCKLLQPIRKVYTQAHPNYSRDVEVC